MKDTRKFLFFSPFSAVFVHAFPEAILAAELSRQGHDVTYVTCGRIYTDCLAMALHGADFQSTPERKRQACDFCQRSKAAMRSGFGLKGFDLKDRLRPEFIEKARAAVRDQPDMKGLYSVEVEGISVGKLAAFEFVTKKKLTELNVSGRDLEQFRESVFNTILTLFLAQEILREVDPDFVMLYSAEYSINGVWAALCRQKNKVAISIQSGSNLSNRLSRLYLNRGSYFYGFQEMLTLWPKRRDLPVSAAEAREVANHFVSLFESSSVFAYSAPKDKGTVSIRKLFSIDPEQKICVAALSSKDEMFAAQMIEQISAFESDDMPFSSQEQWVDSLIEYFRENPDKFLLIRIHPREFPNKRDKVISQNFKRLEAQLVNLPPNVKVNWPSDNLSLYDIMEEADTFLVGWTTAGKEMSFFGLPVVTYCASKIYYPSEFTYDASDRQDFFRKLEKSLEKPFDPAKTILMFRWLSWELIRSTIWIGDVFQWNEHRKRSLLFRALNKATFGNALRFDIYARALFRKRRLNAANAVDQYFSGEFQSPAGFWSGEAISTLDETQAIKAEMFRIYEALYGSRDLPAGTPANTLRARLYAWLSN